MMQIYMDSYHSGEEAARAGMGADTNPYPALSDRGASWALGWNDEERAQLTRQRDAAIAAHAAAADRVDELERLLKRSIVHNHYGNGKTDYVMTGDWKVAHDTAMALGLEAPQS